LGSACHISVRVTSMAFANPARPGLSGV
jgi:hypothetical protein